MSPHFCGGYCSQQYQVLAWLHAKMWARYIADTWTPRIPKHDGNGATAGEGRSYRLMIYYAARLRNGPSF